MAKAMRLAFFLCLLCRLDQAASGAVVYTFRGDEFETVTSPFTTQQFVTGTAVFGSIGESMAESLTLSINGFPGFSITFAGRTGESQSFTWQGAAITAWNINLVDNVVGQSQEEQISSSNSLADAAGYDIFGDDAAGAFNSASGEWTATAVPEPSSVLVVAAMGLAWVGAQRRRRRSRDAARMTGLA